MFWGRACIGKYPEGRRDLGQAGREGRTEGRPGQRRGEGAEGGTEMRKDRQAGVSLLGQRQECAFEEHKEWDTTVSVL